MKNLEKRKSNLVGSVKYLKKREGIKSHSKKNRRTDQNPVLWTCQDVQRHEFSRELEPNYERKVGEL